jgi:PAS domain S-box-containing protein
MAATTRVDFHCHSNFSDGSLSPREVAHQLARDGVAFAALTDHDTLEGLTEFRLALAHRGVGFVTGVELTVQCGEQEAHLLAYGLNPAHPALRATLMALRQAQVPGRQSIADALRNRSSALDGTPDPRWASPNGHLDITAAIDLIHEAGGKAFLAHPLLLEPDLARLRELLISLRDQGLDGLEALYAGFSPPQQQQLCALATELGLLVSAGTDVHERRISGQAAYGLEMPTELWKQFRDAICADGTPDQCAGFATAPQHPRLRLKRRHFFFHVVFPTLLAMGLFVTALFAIFLPTFGRVLMDRKREMIRELTNSAWSILASYERDEKAGRLTRAQAQEMAIDRIRSLRYGREGKDYFWLQDMYPRILMHPYRPDLEGDDVSPFTDPRGEKIFVAFADLVRRQGDGYLDYVWQWKDDPSRLAPKESYIKGFAPWGWIIGTGLYLDDVHDEIMRLERRLIHLSVGIFVVVALLLIYVMKQSLRLERDRFEAEESLRASTERYRSLVEATTEGTLLVLEGRCHYANPIFLELVGFREGELGLLDLADLLPEGPGNETAWENVRRLQEGAQAVPGFEGMLRRRDGELVECVLALSRLAVGERSGFIMIARDVRPQAQALGLGLAELDQRVQGLQEIADNVPVGLLRAKATVRGTVIEANRVADRLLRLGGEGAHGVLSLSALFPSKEAYEGLLAELEETGQAERTLHLSTAAPSTRTLSVRARLVRDDQGRPRHLDVVLEDTTRQEQLASERELAIERLQASLLFLHEPVESLMRSAVLCPLDTTIAAAAALMSAEQSTAVLVQAESGAAMGIVTDADLRERVVAGTATVDDPLYRVMSSPLVTIPARAEVYEALVVMEEKSLQHLAVADESGRILGVVRNQELLHFQSYGPIVLTREIARAQTAAEVIKSARRAPGLAKALQDSGVRPERVMNLLSSVCDAATERFLALAEAEIGPSPVPYAFLALGSQGRQELTFSSDQDNAIVFDAPPETAAAAGEHLLKIGRRVCGWLDQAGFPYCHGEIMAQNPKWCQPLSVWKQYFRDWIQHPEPQQLLEFSIFFDFRAVCGAVELAQELREQVHEAARATPNFLPIFAQNSLQFRPPLRLFGRFVGGGASGEQGGLLNIKEALIPIISFARLYAVKQGLSEARTLERLSALTEQGVLVSQSQQETVAAYSFLQGLRLRHQAAAVQAGQPPDNTISPRKLSQLEETALTQSFAQIAALQKRVSHEFLGGTS